jgi:fluoroquinolone resistance protein
MDLFSEQKEWNTQKFKGETLKNSLADRVEFNACTFNRCAFTETIFQSCKFRDCVFQGCDLSLVKLKDCVFAGNRFENSQIMGVDWTATSWARGAWLKPVDFYGCLLNHSTFVERNMKKIAISKCVCREVDFSDANLSQANCTFSDFASSRFSNTNLTEADFTGASNYSISASHNILKKTKFSLPEAMSLLYSLDIVLTEYPE